MIFIMIAMGLIIIIFVIVVVNIICVFICKVSKWHNCIGSQFVWVWQSISCYFLQKRALHIKNALKFAERNL